MGALVFLVYVLGRYSARYSESLMNIAFDPTVSDISRLLGKMIGAFKPEDATTGVAVWVSMLNFRSLEYSKAPWAREGAHDKNNLFTIAACGIAVDVDGTNDPLLVTRPLSFSRMRPLSYIVSSSGVCRRSISLQHGPGCATHGTSVPAIQHVALMV
jgi:hypothetical protein